MGDQTYPDPGVDGVSAFGQVLYRIPGDANGDGQVNGADYATWAANYGATGATWAQGDFNNDGQVNGADYAIWAANYGAAVAAPAPEPATLVIASIGAALVAARRRRTN
jgi:hypothetical protein